MTVGQYLLSTYADPEGSATPESPPSPEQMQAMMSNLIQLEADMEASGSFVFGGHLHGQDAATVVGSHEGDVVMTDGPFVESKEHLAGFYIINADDLDSALAWAARVSECVGRRIEVWPFAGTGRVADQFPSD